MVLKQRRGRLWAVQTGTAPRKEGTGKMRITKHPQNRTPRPKGSRAKSTRRARRLPGRICGFAFLKNRRIWLAALAAFAVLLAGCGGPAPAPSGQTAASAAPAGCWPAARQGSTASRWPPGMERISITPAALAKAALPLPACRWRAESPRSCSACQRVSQRLPAAGLRGPRAGFVHLGDRPHPAHHPGRRFSRGHRGGRAGA